MAARVLKGLRGSSAARLSLLRSQSNAEFRDHLHRYFESLGEIEHDLAAVVELNGTDETEVAEGNTYRDCELSSQRLSIIPCVYGRGVTRW